MSTPQPPLRSLAARNALVVQWQYLPRHVARRLLRRPHVALRIRQAADLDDLLGAGVLGLIRAAELWDESRGIKAVTYFYTAILRQMLKHLDALSLIRVPFSHFTPEQRVELERQVRTRRLLDEPTARTETHESVDLDVLLADLDATDREMLLQHFHGGRNQAEIGRQYGLSRERVRQRVQRALALLRERWRDEV